MNTKQDKPKAEHEETQLEEKTVEELLLLLLKELRKSGPTLA